MPNRLPWLTQFKIEHRHIVVRDRVLRVHVGESFVPDDIVLCHLSLEALVENGKIAIVTWEDLYPKIAHFMRRLWTPTRTLRGGVRVARVFCRIVICHQERQDRISRQQDWLDVAIHVLPIEVPILDV